MKQLRHHRQLILGICLVIFCLSTAILAPLLAPPDNPSAPEMFKKVGRGSDMVPHPPSSQAIFGTMPGQLDIFYTVVWGMRFAFRFGLLVVVLTSTFGILYGAASAYLSRRVGQFMLRIADAFMAFPVIAAVVFFSQIISIILQDQGGFMSQKQWVFLQDMTPMQKILTSLDPIWISLILFSWMPYARLMNSNVMRLRDLDYIVAAQALGGSHFWVLLRHILPNAITPAVVLAARDFGAMVVLQTTFAFIGLGGKSPWGDILNVGRNWVVGIAGNPFTYWWTFVPATLALVLFGLGWNLLGDGLNDWANPHHRQM